MVPEMDGPLAHRDYFTWFSLCTPITKTLCSLFEPLFLLPTPALIFFAAVDSLGFGCTAPLSLLVPPPKPNSNPINRLDYRDG